MKPNSTILEQEDKKVTFIQYDIPPLKSGEYTLSVSQKVNQQSDPFTTSKQFAVSGERFSFKPEDFHAVFPQNHANGEFDGAFAQVVFDRRTLPWERTSVTSEISTPWLAVISLNEGEQIETVNSIAEDLVPSGTKITVAGSTVTGTGTMDKNIYSYPGFDSLDYGELPTDDCNTIDISSDLFNQIIPSAEDLPYLAHIRKTDTIDKENQKDEEETNYAVVVGNRVPLNNKKSYAYLVSLENMGNNLPGSDGTNNLPPGTTSVRLIVYKNWSYTVNTRDQNFKQLLENLNKVNGVLTGVTNIQLPLNGPAPAAAEVQSALLAQTQGKLTDAQANVILDNAFQMGYVPFNNELRHGGKTVTWYRGPLLPYAAKETLDLPISCPDGANRYNPQTGLFDASYGAAWQLGQFLALQNNSFAIALYNWKKKLTLAEIAAAEQKILEKMLSKAAAFQNILATRRSSLLGGNPPVPDIISDWLGKLFLLYGVPFNYLVPDEKMLPTESIHFFEMDLNWVYGAIDGAFSIGRSTSNEASLDSRYFERIKQAGKKSLAKFRKQKLALSGAEQSTGIFSGFIMRSAVLSGWSSLEVNGYSDLDGEVELPKRRMSSLSDQVLLCIFEGSINMVAIHEPPEALHEGVEGESPNFTTTLRQVIGTEPGAQIPETSASVFVRADGQTFQVKKTAENILKNLNDPPLSEGLTKFTSAEYALEMIKGVAKVEFKNDTKP